MPKPNLVSGIQPTGKLHLGNYLGMAQNAVALQKSGKYKCFYFLADLHSLTEEFSPKTKTAQIAEVLAEYLALGLDPERSVIFQQSQVAAHSELAWLFSTIAPMGELERMTQFKDKSIRQQENINVGLFTYPVLMAADIALYDAAFVPVGDDQLQHLELTRTLIRKFNSRFGNTFVEPKHLLGAVPRVMSLKDPAKKMSKSDPSGCIFLDDAPETIMEKVKRAVTDSGTSIFYDPENKPAISNLLGIWSALTGEDVKDAQERFGGQSYAEFKTELGKTIAKHFADFRTKKAALLKKPAALKKILKDGSTKAEKIAEKKMSVVRKKIGLVV